MKKVIVTGAKGFIGRHSLKTLIEKGFEVHAITSSDLPEETYNSIWHQVNLLDTSQIETLMRTVQPTHLLHFAWYAIPGKYWTSEQNFLWVQASIELIRQFRENGGQRVVIAGTCAEYDWKYGYCSELVTPVHPKSPYSVCKRALQEIVNSYSELTGLSSVWGRIFWAYGPHEYPQRLVPFVISSLLQGELANCSHGNQIRDFLYVQDVADAFVAILESEITGPVNIGSGQPMSIKEIVYQIAGTIGKPESICLGAIPASINEPPLLVADVSLLSKNVGWQPQYDLERGLVLTINWWKNHLGI
ncbi:MAG: NAD(P)-dependent oxidoreductase [Cyanobacteria bacterium P01_H01_bin.35]